MKRTILLIFAILLFFAQASAQLHVWAPSEKKVLYLLATDAEKLSDTEEVCTLDAFNGSVVGFWCGAQLALEEMDNGGESNGLQVIVRDINARDTAKLLRLFSEPDIQDVDLIIAPVPKNVFPLVADFAYTHKIRAINPFSTSTDIIVNNPYVYKLMPNALSHPIVVNSYFPGDNLILWHDEPNPELAMYESFFAEKNIAYRKVEASQPLLPFLSHSKNNVVIACTNKAKNFSGACSALNTHKVTWIVPESLVLDNNFDARIFQEMPVYFFSNCFFDPNSEAYKVFQYNYFKRFGALPTLESFATQGYDITRYFVGDLRNHSCAFERPISYSFRFIQKENGGYENFGARLVQFTNLSYKIIQPQ